MKYCVRFTIPVECFVLVDAGSEKAAWDMVDNSSYGHICGAIGGVWKTGNVNEYEAAEVYDVEEVK